MAGRLPMSWKLFSLLLEAAVTTAWISAISISAGLALGLVICTAGFSRRTWVAGAARLYVSFFRGVPLLVQLLLVYHLLPVLGLNVSSNVAAIMALTLCSAAYQAENLKGGFLSVPNGLVEAAQMVGMTSFQRFRRIVAPVALRLTIPAIVNEAVAILHASALVSVVGVMELTKMTRDLSASTLEPLPLFLMAGAIYIAMNIVLTTAGARAERLFRLPGA